MKKDLKDTHLSFPKSEVDLINGLNDAQVEERVRTGWKNELIVAEGKSVKDIVMTNLFTYFNLIFLIISILLISVGSFRNLTFLPIIIANTLIGIIQEIRAKRILDQMKILNAPHTCVKRNGEEIMIPSTELVKDDIVRYGAGNQISADATVISGVVYVNEALLTGESDDIKKVQGDPLMSGSYIISGSCHAQLTAVGRESYVSKLTMEAKTLKHKETSEMIKSLNRILFIVGILIIPIGLILMWQGLMVNQLTLKESVTSMVAAILGMIPEGLYLLTSIALVVSTMRLAEQKVLLHNMKSIETLARVNVLCVDKTGTITGNEITVSEYIAMGEIEKDSLNLLLGDFVNLMSEDNITMTALKKYFVSHRNITAKSMRAFSSKYKYCGVTMGNRTYILGAPEMVLREDYPENKKLIDRYTAKGGRVLLFAEYEGTLDQEELNEKARPLGLIVLDNPIRENAKETFTYFKEQGVQVKVISGDNPVTVSEVARKAGIEGAFEYVDARTLETEEQIQAAADKYNVFGRVTTEQKKQLILAMKYAGNTVAMTGDGVNDVLALKEADCSIAMASGSDAAAHASQVVLLESDFSKMPSVAAEGRRVVNNIERSASLFLVKNMFSILMALLSILTVIRYPLEPTQVSLVTMFRIGIPGFLMTLEPNENLIKGRFIHNVCHRALPAALADLVAISGMVFFGNLCGFTVAEISTASTLLMSFVGFMLLFHLGRPVDKTTASIILVCLTGFILSSIFLKNLFFMAKMSMDAMLLTSVFMIILLILYIFSNFFMTKNEIRKRKKQENNIFNII